MDKVVVIFVLMVFSLGACAQPSVTAASTAAQLRMLQSSDAQLVANKKLVFDFWREVFQTHDMTSLRDYVSESYIQHNPNIGSGLPPFIDYFGQLKRRPVKPDIDNLVSMVAEGDMVVLAFKRVLADPGERGKSYTTTWFDMFRIKEGKIVEHWDGGTKSER